jgi:glycosyltransferase involved in cell wall biosynthesis
MSQVTAPLVSVIIPCYNQGIYLETAVKSVLKQSYSFYEIIIINDGSTCPRTIHILKNASFPRTTILHTVNRGVASARNEGISKAKGKYILPLDADDKLGPDYIRGAVAVLEADEEVGIVYCRAEHFGLLAGPVKLADYSIEQMLYDNIIFCSGFFRRDDWQKVGGYHMEMRYALEDYDFWLSILSLGRKVVRLPDCHFYYRINFQSRSTQVTSKNYLEMRRQIYLRHRDLYLKHADSLFVRIFQGIKECHELRHQVATVPYTRFFNLLSREWFRLKRAIRGFAGRG